MGDGVGNIREKALQQVLALEELERERADAEDRCEAYHKELLGTMAALLEKPSH